MFSPNCREFGRRWHKRQYTASAFYPISHFDLQTGGRVQENIHSRAKLDQSDSFSPFYSVACFFREHNPSRQKARDLLEFDPLSVAFHGDDNYIGMDFIDPPVDFTGVAKSLGLEATRVTDPSQLKSVLSSAFSRRGAKLIEVVVSNSVN